MHFIGFYLASICVSAVLGVVILSIRPSHAWFVTNPNNALRIFWYLTTGQSLCFSDTNSGWWRRPLLSEIWSQSDPSPFEKRRLRQISAYNVSTVRDSETSSIMTNRKSTTDFPMSYRWSAYVTPKSRKGGSKSDFFVFWVKVNGWSCHALST